MRAFGCRWREGDWQHSERLFGRAHELAEQIGWSEVSFGALLGLSVTLRDSDELDRAETVLTQALAVCDRAGLLAQSVQAHSARALVFTLGGRHDAARAAADEAATIGERIRYPVAEAAALEARGITGEMPAAADTLRQARGTWDLLGRRLEVARCDLLLGLRLRDDDPAAAAPILAGAAKAYDELGVAHLAARARELTKVA